MLGNYFFGLSILRHSSTKLQLQVLFLSIIFCRAVTWLIGENRVKRCWYVVVTLGRHIDRSIHARMCMVEEYYSIASITLELSFVEAYWFIFLADEILQYKFTELWPILSHCFASDKIQCCFSYMFRISVIFPSLFVYEFWSFRMIFLVE